jgi:hypothetical protein
MVRGDNYIRFGKILGWGMSILSVIFNGLQHGASRVIKVPFIISSRTVEARQLPTCPIPETTH